MLATLLGILAAFAKFLPTLVRAGDVLYSEWTRAREANEAEAERKRLDGISARAAMERASIADALLAAEAERDRRAKEAAKRHAEWLEAADARANKALEDAATERARIASDRADVQKRQ